MKASGSARNFASVRIFTRTAPEGATLQNGIETETVPDAGAPRRPGSPPDSGAVTRPACAVTGSFSSIPSTALPATLTGTKLGANFNMVGDFVPTVPGVGCTCACGEYRQYVAGTFTANGANVTHYIGPGVTLHPTRLQLDGNATTANYFGRRNFRTSYSHFEPDQATGCQFQGNDIPGISAPSGTALAVNLSFQGDLIDTCNVDRVLATSTWSVVGSATVP